MFMLGFFPLTEMVITVSCESMGRLMVLLSCFDTVDTRFTLSVRISSRTLFNTWKNKQLMNS